MEKAIFIPISIPSMLRWQSQYCEPIIIFVSHIKQKELWKHAPSSSIHGSNLSDLVGGLGWKGTGILILLAIFGFIIYAVFFR